MAGAAYWDRLQRQEGERDPLLLRDFLASLASRSLTDGGQVFQADETVGIVVHDALADPVIGRLLQPTSSELIEEEHF